MPGDSRRLSRVNEGDGRSRPTGALSPTAEGSAEPSKTRWTLLAVVAAAAVFLAWEIIATTAADAVVAGNPESALGWRSNAPSALVGWAERRLSDAAAEADLRSVEAALIDALRADPMDSRPLQLLGRVAEHDGDPERASALMRLAVERNIRDATAQAWLFMHAALQRDFEGSMEHLDALLRARPTLGEPLVPILVELAQAPESVPAVAARLAENPPWRRWFLDAVSQKARPAAALAGLFTNLKGTASPPLAGEMSIFLWRLISSEQYELAYLNWVTNLPDDRLGLLGRITNGGFEARPTALPFDWRFNRIRGATTSIEEVTGGSRALRVSFHGTRVPYRHTSQILFLPAGRYEMSGRVRASNLRTPRGLRWTISCANARGSLGASELVVGTVPWSPFSFPFEVPDGRVCRAQQLLLEIAARIPSEEQVLGEIWYDDLSIEPAESGEIATPAENVSSGGNLQ